MAAFAIKTFSGMRPRVPASLLSSNEAQSAENCDFAYGELRSLKGHFAFGDLSNTAKSLYTDDGVSFFSWADDVSAVRSPIVGDPYHRVYFTREAGGLYSADRLAISATGGEPAESIAVGVPRPSSAPSLASIASTPVNSTNADISFKFHEELSGVKYQEAALAATPIDASNYSVSLPTLDATTPAGAFPVIRMTAVSSGDGTPLFDIYTNNSSFHDSSSQYQLAMAQNGNAVTLTLSYTPSAENQETRAYCYTYVNRYGEEGAPSDAALVTCGVDGKVDVTVFKDGDGEDLKEARIYRTGTGTSSTDYYFAGKIGIEDDAQTSFLFEDETESAELAETMESVGNYPPPAALKGLMRLPNGMLAGFTGNELYFSEAYKPHAWNPANVLTFPSDIVNGIVTGSGLLITTRQFPYLISGVAPGAMTASKINVNQAGVSMRSIAIVNGKAVYASNDGLVSVDGAQAELQSSEKFFTREVWRERVGAGFSTMAFAVWDGRLIVFSTEAKFTAFMIRFDEAEGTMTELPGFSAQCAFVSPLSDECYFCEGKTLYEFAGGDDLEASWTSSEKVLAYPVNFGAAQIISEGDWTFALSAFVRNAETGAWEWQVKHTESVSSKNHLFRLPSGYESDRYRYAIQGKGRFRELRVAQTFMELKTL
jgi:hypothetical protein